MPPTCNSIRRNSHALLLWIRLGIDPLYLLVVLVCTVLGLAAQNYINSTYKTWSKVRSDGDTGATVARRMLDANGCNAVGIKGVAGELTDHYNPQDNNLYLSDANRSGGSVASVAVACHEAGHAAQRQSGYAMMKVRTALRAGRQLYPEHLDHRVAHGSVYEHRGTHDPRADLLLVLVCCSSWLRCRSRLMPAAAPWRISSSRV